MTAEAAALPLTRSQMNVRKIRKICEQQAEDRRAAAAFRASDPLEQALTCLRSSGYPAWRAEDVDGEPRWMVGTRALDRAAVLAMAARQPRARRANAPSPIAKNSEEQEGQEDAAMADKLRGLNEADVRADLEMLRREWGGTTAAARALGIGKSSLGNLIAGRNPISAGVMCTLYTPGGTQLRPEVRGPINCTPAPAPPESAFEDVPEEPPGQPCGDAVTAAARTKAEEAEAASWPSPPLPPEEWVLEDHEMLALLTGALDREIAARRAADAALVAHDLRIERLGLLRDAYRPGAGGPAAGGPD